MSSKIFKNYQVNLGVPFPVKNPINFQTIRKVEMTETSEEDEESLDARENPEEIVQKAREQAEMIIKEAQIEALKLIENTEVELNENKVQIEEEARRKGYDEGTSEAKRQFDDLTQEAELIREHAKVEYKEVLAGIESDAVNMILEIARKVIGTEISFNKDDILYLVKQAFEKCANKERIVLKVSPLDYEFLISNKERLLSMVEGIGELDIKREGSLKEGACIIETPFGSIDASVETKLKKIEEAFNDLINE